MKILHFADLHLGIEQYGTVDPDTGLSSRLADVLKVLDETVEYALGNDVDLVLFCGDAYRSRDPSQTQQRELARRVKRLSEAGIPVLLLVGNHDLPNAPGRANTLEIFQTLGVSNVHVASRPAIHRIDTRRGPLQVAALPWLRRSGLLSKEESRGLTIEQVLQRLQEMLGDTIAFLARSVDPSLPAVLAAHVSISTAKLSSERTMMVIGREPVLLVSNIALPAFDYIALGHIHKAQILSESPPMTYSGSLERVDFSEEQDEKGFYVLEIRPDGRPGTRCVDLTFHPVSARPFLTIEITLDAGTPDPTAAVLAALALRQQEVKDAVVRLEVNCPEQLEGQLQESELRRALKEASWVSITRNVARETRTRLGERPVEELTPRQALELYLDSKKTPAEQKRTLLEYGERLFWEHQSRT
ncbi:MAG: exonuclease SbcCD subunit D [Chloroflexota bacterium]